MKRTFHTLVALACLIGCAVAALPAQQKYTVPTEAQNRQYRNNPCADPWVTLGLRIHTASTRDIAGVGSMGECDPKRYANGNWSNFDQLMNAIEASLKAKDQARLSESLSRVSQGYKIDTLRNGSVIGSALVGHDGGSLIGLDGATLVAAGGGNFRLQSINGHTENVGGGLVLFTKR